MRRGWAHCGQPRVRKRKNIHEGRKAQSKGWPVDLACLWDCASEERCAGGTVVRTVNPG